MKSFSTYLFETMFQVQHDHNLGYRVHYHQFNHNGKTVILAFGGASNGEGEGHYFAHFDVNGYTSAKERSHEYASIFHRIRDLTHHFIREKNPKSITFKPADGNYEMREQKHKLYRKFSQHLAQHYGGTHYDGWEDYTVEFPKK